MAGVDGVGLARMVTPRVWRGSGAPSGFTVPDGETRSDAAHGVGAPMALGGGWASKSRLTTRRATHRPVSRPIQC